MFQTDAPWRSAAGNLSRLIAKARSAKQFMLTLGFLKVARQASLGSVANVEYAGGKMLVLQTLRLSTQRGPPNYEY